MEREGEHSTVFSWRSFVRPTTRVSLHGASAETLICTSMRGLAVSLPTTPASSGIVVMELMDRVNFIQSLKRIQIFKSTPNARGGGIPKDALRSIEEDRFGIFPGITNRGIQIWLPVSSYYANSGSLFLAWLPCRCGPRSTTPVSITLALWQSDYYRYFVSLPSSIEYTLQFRQLYLRYQDTSHRNTTFEIDNTENNFIQCGEYPSEFTGSTLTLTNTCPLCVRVYSDSDIQANCYFAVVFGQCFGQHWIRCACTSASGGYSWQDYAREVHGTMQINGPEHVQSMADAEARSPGEHGDRVWIIQTHLPGSTWTLQTSRVIWQSSRIGVRFENFRYPGFSNVSNKWTGLDLEVGGISCTHV